MVMAVLGLAVKTQAQTAPDTNAPASLNGLTAATNWVVVPFGIYDTTDKKWGWGAAALYQVTPIFYTGMRVDFLNNQEDTAGIQAQLQITKTWHGINITPFVETSVGIGKSTLYGSAGAGGVVSLHAWAFKIGQQAFNLNIGIAGDMEHVVNNNRNYNQICGGPLLQLTF
jgi:hypothetical protein